MTRAGQEGEKTTPIGSPRIERTLLWLFAASLLARVILSFIRITYGVPPYLAFPVPWLNAIRLYNDFDGYYVNQLHFMAQGFLPYRDIGYNFPPLFLYSLYPFYIIGGPAAAGIPVVLSDAATAPFLYLLVRSFSRNTVALAAGLAYALSPFMLLYEGYLWIGSQPMTFFLVLSLYLFQRKKPVASFVSLAVAVLFRQQALLILPVYAIWSFKEYRGKVLQLILVFLAVMLVASAPFLILIPGQYISSLSYLPLYNWTPIVPNPSETGGSPTTFTVNFCTPLSRNATGYIFSCNIGTSSYLEFAPFGSPLLILVNNLSFFLRVPLSILILPLLYVARRKANSLELTCAYASAISVTIFSILVHNELRYYYLPFYCLLLASTASRGGLAIAIGSSMLSFLIPEIALQEMIPLFALLAIILVEEIAEVRKASPIPPESVEPGPPRSHPIMNETADGLSQGAWTTNSCPNFTSINIVRARS